MVVVLLLLLLLLLLWRLARNGGIRNAGYMTEEFPAQKCRGCFDFGVSFVAIGGCTTTIAAAATSFAATSFASRAAHSCDI